MYMCIMLCVITECETSFTWWMVGAIHVHKPVAVESGKCIVWQRLYVITVFNKAEVCKRLAMHKDLSVNC